MTMIRLALALILFAFPAAAEVAVQPLTSPGGIKVWLVENHDIPFTALEIRFRGGTSLDAPGARGAVNLMTALIEEGSGDLDAQAFAKARDNLATEFRFRSDADTVSVSARFLTENADAAAGLLRDALVSPRFDADAIERVRGQVLTGLRANEKDPETLASQALWAGFFPGHPYGSTGDGTIDSVTALTRDDILAAHRGALARDRVYVAATGDISAEALGALIDRLLGDLPATGAPLPARAAMSETGRTAVIPFPGPQSVVAFGHRGLPFDDPDYIAASMLNEIIGGGRFGARLMTELREKRGLTYGVSTSLVPMDQGELILGQFTASNEKASEAVDLLRQEWARVATESVTPEEIAATKTYMTGAYPLRFDGNGRIAGILVGMQMMGLTPDYITTRNAKVEAVTEADLKRVAARLFHADQLQIVVVGEPAGVVPSP